MSFNKYRTKGAYHYNWYETEDWYKYLIDRAVKFCKGSTLDVGGGEGLLASKIVSKGHRAVVIDNDDTAESICFAAGLEFWRYDIDQTYPSQTLEPFDYVACINTIEHLNKPEVIKEIIKDTKKGAIITTIDYQGGPLGEDHKFEWTYDEMMDFFKEFNPKGFRYKDTEWIGVEIRK